MRHYNGATHDHFFNQQQLARAPSIPQLEPRVRKETAEGGLSQGGISAPTWHQWIRVRHAEFNSDGGLHPAQHSRRSLRRLSDYASAQFPRDLYDHGFLYPLTSPHQPGSRFQRRQSSAQFATTRSLPLGQSEPLSFMGISSFL